jgi:hypothetical protein
VTAKPEKTDGKQKTRFKPGQSGNPNGRPNGARNATTIAIEELLDGEAEALTRKAIELAKAGDMQALRLCMDSRESGNCAGRGSGGSKQTQSPCATG